MKLDFKTRRGTFLTDQTGFQILSDRYIYNSKPYWTRKVDESEIILKIDEPLGITVLRSTVSCTLYF